METTSVPKTKAKPRAKPGNQPSAAMESGEAPVKGRKAPRPAVHYSVELGKRICDLIAEGGSIPKICMMPGMPTERSLWNWERQHEEFAKEIEQARERRADAQFEALAELTEDVRTGKLAPNEGRVVFDMMKFRIQQDGRRRYADRPVAVDVKVGVGIQGQIDTQKWIEGVLAGTDRTNVVPLLPHKREPSE